MLNANPDAVVKTGEANEYYENYYNVPSVPEGILGVKTFDRITIQNLYPGIDWVLYIKNNQLKYDLLVHEGADYRQIQMQYKGADEIKLTAEGELFVNTPLGSITEEKPYTYLGESSKEIKSQYLIDENDIIKFQLNGEIKGRVVIDPGLIWATYYGGTAGEDAYSVCTDKLGYVYITGATGSNNYISSNAFQSSPGSLIDIFIIKFDSSGNRLWGTYYGGKETEQAYSITTDNSENIYIVGYTEGSAAFGYNGFKNSYGGGYWDAFLVKLTTNGYRIWSTFYGASRSDVGNSVCTDNLSNVYLAGGTGSIDSISYNGFQSYLSGNSDGFLVKFDSSGIRLWASYFGGDDDDYATAVSMDRGGNVFLAGVTQSKNGLAYNGHQNTFGGATTTDVDAFVVKFDSSCNRKWATYYGGSDQDYGKAISIDSSGNAYLGGYTKSTNAISHNGYQNTYGGGNYDGFLAMLDSSCTRKWATYYGGLKEDQIRSISIDNNQYIYVCGDTYSNDAISNYGYQDTSNGPPDAFLVKFNTEGTNKWATFFGGPSLERGFGVTVDNCKSVYMCGTAHSGSNIAKNGFRTLKYGYSDAYLTKFYVDRINNIKVVQNGYCPNDTILVLYYKTIEMAYGNEYAFQLSDTSGNFDSAITVYTKVDSVGGIDTSKFILPRNVLPSFKYKLRILTTAPADTIYSEDTIKVYSSPQTSFSLDSSALCGINTISFINTSFIFSGTNTYYWNFGDSTYSDSVSPSKLYSNYGIYSVKLHAVSENGCQDSVINYISIGHIPNVSFTVIGETCEKNNLFFKSNSTILSGVISLYWDFGDSITSDSISPVKSYFSSGTYNASLLAISDLGCKDSVSQKIVINPMANAQFIANNANQCLLTNNFTFQNTSTISSGSLAYTWSFGDSTRDTVTSPIKVYSETGTYTVWLKAITDKNCTDSISKLITVNPHPTADINILTNNLCGDTARLEAANMQAGNKFAWLTNGLPVAGDTLARFTSMQSASVMLAQVNAFGCWDTSSSVNVIVRAVPAKPTLSVSSFIINAGDGYTNYEWYKDGSVINGETDSVITVAQNGDYHCKVTNADSCENWSDTMSITNVSVHRAGIDNSISIYPNPGNGIINVEFFAAGDNTITVYDISGRLLLSKPAVERSEHLDLQYLSKGIYLLKVNGDNYSYTTKIIIE
ncbi:MAG TPA: SBBP repeat-containing protein [Bacteroidia bacterium]|nr:SBBP repeat-containing protein [Bacteroidia bacterium]